MQVTTQDVRNGPGGSAARRETGALVLRAVRLALEGKTGAAFLWRRAWDEVGRLDTGDERRRLAKLLHVVAEPTSVEWPSMAALLAAHAAACEGRRWLEEAAEALRLAVWVDPTSPDAALRAARVERLRGRREEAARLYARVRELDDGSGEWARLAMIGDALLQDDPEQALSRAMRVAVRAGDSEAAAVALEERAEARLASGNEAGAVRDLCVSALRYGRGPDRARVSHRLADLLASRGDRAGVREALLAALATGDEAQRAYATNRLHDQARLDGDDLGVRRWRQTAAPLVSLAPARSASHAAAGGRQTRAPQLRRWRIRLEEARSA